MDATAAAYPAQGSVIVIQEQSVVIRQVRTLSVRTRFYLVMGLVSLSLVVLGAWSLLDSRTTNGPAARLFDQAMAASDQVGDLRESLSALRRYEAAMIATAVSNSTEVEPLHLQWKKQLERLKTAGAQLVSDNPGNPQLAELVATQNKLLGEYAATIEPIAVQLKEAKMDASAGLAYAQRANDTLEALQANTGALLKAQHAHADSLRAEMADDAATAAWARLALVVATLLVVLPLMVATLRSVCGPLDRAVLVTRRIADGDLTSHIDTRGSDEPARLLQGLAAMQQALGRVVGQVRASSASIEAASREVASGNLDLSHRTEQAAKHLQSTASAMEELSAKVRHSAESADTANQLAGSASAVAQRGGSVVGDVVATMNDIHASSQRIADIIATIDGIAFQTNILALNAAVEAARAGEQGRGFAVVAGEVRSLAQRSAEAAREIKTLIGASVDRVDAGARLVNDAGGTMGEIVASVQQVRDMIGGITAVSGTQSQDLAQISGAITQLDQVTQQNAALVEESAAAAESLKAQAEALAAVVATFRLDGEGAASSTTAHATAASSLMNKLRREPATAASTTAIEA
ncbi:methyl-accepting chemotaxis protein [Aquincola tertiaricarbonis]|uniref:Methyl-accepting chemotaxis protein n=1 Tax=Aquincola tertiaricarbonis TaxID=391953 RepID=A0ABY4S8J8_AQUTE|nr:methyl-accepting chemotaxis protein [Aquincola tertiaricarbonis]URI09319.1 methyl-accepting chemotaxis protein [Aquincola tertiaricarbonis]